MEEKVKIISENKTDGCKKLNTIKLICNWQFLTIYIVKFVTDLSLKNDGINTSFVVDICIEKAMGIGLHFFHKEN